MAPFSLFVWIVNDVINALVCFATVLDGAAVLHTLHAGLFHNTLAGDVFLKSAGDDLPEAVGKEVGDDSLQGFGAVALILISRGDHVAQLDGIVVDTRVVEESDKLIFQINARHIAAFIQRQLLITAE